MIRQLLVLLLIGFSLGFRLFYVSHFNFAFTIDQARDMLEIRKIAVDHHLVMIGPTTSINGVYLGPFWYYFNLPAFLLSHGDPTSLVLWGVISYHLAVLIFWYVHKKTNPDLAIIGTFLLLVSPRLTGALSYSFNANAAPTFVILCLVLLELVLKTKKPLLALILGFLIGFSFQIEAAFCILLLPLAIYWFLKDRVHFLRPLAVGFVVTLIPQIAFEIKHRFLMTKIFFAEFAGQGNILGEKLPLGQRFLDRYHRYLGDLYSSLPISQLVIWLLLLCLILIIFQKTGQKLAQLSVSLVLLSIPFYLIFPQILKPWYTISLAVPFVLIFAGGLSLLLSSHRLGFRLFALFLLTAMAVNSFTQLSHQLEYKLTTRSADRASLFNQIKAVDGVYDQAKGTPFKVYDYSPSVYDFNYQYLFWWYGSKTYGYQPMTITYADNVPPYLQSSPKYQTNIRSGDRPLIFLIEEGRPGFEDQQSTWRRQFSDLCKMGETELVGNIVVEKLTACHEKK